MGRAPRFALLASLAALAAADHPEGARAGGDELARTVAAFEARTGARLVFSEADLPAGNWFEIKRELPAARRADAARIALAEAERLPAGFLGSIGIEAIGLFDGLASSQGDGFRPWNDDLGGYRYFGEWNGTDAVIAAYYTDEQLPLTLHHEIFHHVDATFGGVTSDAAFEDDDDRFARALDGEPYAAAAISKGDLAKLRRAGDGDVLDDAVSDYTAKSPNEDQAETARWMWSHLPDALVQIAEQPELAGSQRLLHVIDQYATSSAIAPDLAWLVDVALGRDPVEGRALMKVAAKAAALEAQLRARIAPDGRFVVWGTEDRQGVNKTLRADLARFAKVARAVVRAGRRVDGAGPVIGAALARDLRLLARYHEHVTSRWTVTAGTARSFSRAREALLAAILDADADLGERLRDRPWADLADAGAEPPPAADNPYQVNVDAEIGDTDVRAAIHQVQPATIKLGGGSGVNLDSRGVFLTAAHVVDELGAELTVRFPDGTEVAAVTTAIDTALDVAVLEPIDARDGGALPWAPLAASAPDVGTGVVVIGHPGKWTPDGDATGYQPWNVSVGEIRGFDGEPLDDQRMGGVEHDAWTYWGHSGSPLFDERGRIVALHNSWDSRNAMRHAVTYQAIRHLLDDADVPYHLAD
jgi:S1-C subfamily serine protease